MPTFVKGEKVAPHQKNEVEKNVQADLKTRQEKLCAEVEENADMDLNKSDVLTCDNMEDKRDFESKELN